MIAADRLPSSRATRTLALALCCLAWVAATAPAEGARTATKSERMALLKAAATSDGGSVVGLRVGRGGRVTMQPLGWRSPATVLAVRSSIDRSWAMVVAYPKGDISQRSTFLLQRRTSRWRVRMVTRRGEEADGICRRSRPGTAVVLDLGLSSNTWSRKCRHRRDRRTLVRRMTASELGSVRAMVEWTWDTGQAEPGPVQPAVHDVFASDCSWDGRGKLVPPPVGEVARSDPRWGLVSLSCAIGSDGFGVLESTTVLLVARAGRSGAFTRVPAHTLPAWSARGGLCGEDRRWPIAAAPRVALEFCTPFPAAIRNALR